LKIPLLKGRVWSEAENNRRAHIAVINEEMARRFWPNSDAIGQRIRLPEFKAFTSWILAAKESNGWMEIIGVVGNTPNRGLREPIAPAAYVPYTLRDGRFDADCDPDGIRSDEHGARRPPAGPFSRCRPTGR